MFGKLTAGNIWIVGMNCVKLSIWEGAAVERSAGVFHTGQTGGATARHEEFGATTPTRTCTWHWVIF